MRKPRLFIVHGWEGHPRIHWLGWLAKEAQALGFVVFAPQFQSPDLPLCEDWITILQNEVGTPTEHDFFVGHSLGAIAILRYLETLDGKLSAEGEEHIGGAIFVSGFATSVGVKETESFFEGAVDFERVKRKSKHGFVAINSDNDPYVPMERAEELRDGLGARLVVLHGAGHINTDAGYVELPEAVEELRKWVK